MMLARLGSSRLSSVRRASSAAARGALLASSAPRSSAGNLSALKMAAAAAAAAAALIAPPDPARCHCQVPCGIFDDPARVSLLREHAATIRKAMFQIEKLASCPAPSGEQLDAQSFNQAARWVAVKEEAASEIITIVSEYMLCQRVKKDSFKDIVEYWSALQLHHELMQSAMKAKQTVDVAACDKLDHCITAVGTMYTK